MAAAGKSTGAAASVANLSNGFSNNWETSENCKRKAGETGKTPKRLRQQESDHGYKTDDVFLSGIMGYYLGNKYSNKI